MQYEVLRPFTATDRVLAVGEHVETNTWRPEAITSLTERKYIQPLGSDQAQSAATKEKRHG